eukprot:PhM_4_TR8413/c6_g1_i2/m.8090
MEHRPIVVLWLVFVSLSVVTADTKLNNNNENKNSHLRRLPHISHRSRVLSVDNINSDIISVNVSVKIQTQDALMARLPNVISLTSPSSVIYMLDKTNNEIYQLNLTSAKTVLSTLVRRKEVDSLHAVFFASGPKDELYFMKSSFPVTIYVMDMTGFSSTSTTLPQKQVLVEDSSIRDPEDFVVLPNGRLYLTESGRCDILDYLRGERAFYLAAGNGKCASDDGTFSSASFYYPQRIASDGSSNILYVTEKSHIVRKLDLTSKTVTLLAGTPFKAGLVDGNGKKEAMFRNPLGLSVAAPISSSSSTPRFVTIFVADTGNNCIRKIVEDRTNSSNVTVFTFVGSPTGEPGYSSPSSSTRNLTEIRFRFPSALAVITDKTHQTLVLFVADTQNGVIQRIIFSSNHESTTATLTTQSGVALRDPTADSENMIIYRPHGAVCVSGKGLYLTANTDLIFKFSEEYNNKVMFVPSTKVLYSQRPRDLRGFDIYSFGLFIADASDAHVIRYYDLKSSTMSIFAGTLSTAGYVNNVNATSAQFSLPTDVNVVSSTSLVVLDSVNKALQRVAFSESSSSVVATTVVTLFSSPTTILAMTCDATTGMIYYVSRKVNGTTLSGFTIQSAHFVTMGEKDVVVFSSGTNDTDPSSTLMPSALTLYGHLGSPELLLYIAGSRNSLSAVYALSLLTKTTIEDSNSNNTTNTTNNNNNNLYFVSDGVDSSDL